MNRREKSFVYSVCSILLQLLFIQAHAGGITGKVTSAEKEPLSFSNIYVKGSTKGTTANTDGIYRLELAPGNYVIVFRYMGYKLQEKNVTVNEGYVRLDAVLEPEQVLLQGVVITDQAEDPAYQVIRQAIKKRGFYNNLVKEYSCEVYIKGVQRLLDMPDRILGMSTKNMEINGSAANDSNLKGILYLSESISNFNYKHPGKVHEVMVSSKVSGRNNAFSYNKASDMLFNFYENLMRIESVSERAFVSPVANNALFYYRYKLLGAFIENNYLVNKIEVTPKRKQDPCFRGVIYIVENDWRIHSADLYLTANTQINFVDTLRLQQVFAPIEKDVWMPISNKFTFHFDVMGIEGSGYYLGVNRNYNLQPAFDKKTFKGPQWEVLDESNKKDSLYWDSIRPVELSVEEKTDYRKKDSIQAFKNSEPYLDSLDKKFNRFRIGAFITNGYDFRNRYRKESWTVSGLLRSLQYNTVEGTVINMSVSYDKELEHKRRLFIAPTLRYGFSNQHFNAKFLLFKNFNNRKFASGFIDAGSDVSQFNNRQPITPFLNSFYTLLSERNYMKLYEKQFIRTGYRRELTNGVYLRSELEYAHRYSLVNTGSFKLVDDVVNEFESNDPQNPLNTGPSFAPHQSLVAVLQFNIRIKQQYDLRPDRKIINGSKFPMLQVAYRKGIANVLGSDADFDQIRLGCSDDMRVGLLGTLSYRFTAGTFLSYKQVYFMDQYHFSANRTFALRKITDAGDVGNNNDENIAGFNLNDYYVFSTPRDFIEAHAEHHFNGFILNKFPGLRKTKFQEVVGAHYLLMNGSVNYFEFSVGLEHIGLGNVLPGFLRIDYIISASDIRSQNRQGLRFGIGF